MGIDSFERFDTVSTALTPGINLIEASAGTGKTFAIAMLALRFVVELGMPIEQLLVVTFTKAATEELKERIRARLAAAKHVLDGQAANGDPVLQSWLQTLPVERKTARQRLQLALLDIDRAGIFTIHGFCQRVLNEHALESGQVFDAELSGDQHALHKQIAADFWRKQVLTAEPQVAALYLTQCNSPESLLHSIGKLPGHVPVYPTDVDVVAALPALRDAMREALQVLPDIAAKLHSALPEGCFKSEYGGAVESRLRSLQDWLTAFLRQSDNVGNPIEPSLPLPERGESNASPTPPHSSVETKSSASLVPDVSALQLLTRQTLLDGLNGHKFKTTKTQSGEQRRQQYLDELGINTTPFDTLLDHFRKLNVAFRRAFVEFLRGEREKTLRHSNELSFDDLIANLAEALQGERAEWLQRTLRQRFKAALIDEFQDTDQQQWHIFSTLFGAGESYLYLIGDPKQAIYKFRGADIFSYFEAQQQAARHYTLQQNWRSQPLLVEAVNTLFKRHPRPFWFEQLHFITVSPGLDKEQPQFLPPLLLWQLAASDTKDGHWSAGKARQLVQQAVVQEIRQLCAGNGSTAPVAAQDIAVLVRTNQAAREYRQALQAAGIAAVLNSVESVFATPEAIGLHVWLQALAHPGDTALLKQALTLPWFGLDGQALYRLANDEAAQDAWTLRFQEYHRQWQERGFMAMMLEALRREGIYAQLTRGGEAERQIANLQQLLELLQQACIEEHLGLHKTLDWLREAIADAAYDSGDERQLRLESDAQAVQIVTLHRSKGLEYPVVFCPDLWQHGDRLAKENWLLECHEQGRRIADLGSEQFEARREQALREELAEDLRIVYVALTRAKYRCYLAWADVRSKERANGSALAYLLFSAGGEDWRESLRACSFSTQQQILQSLSAQSLGFAYRLLDTEPLFQPEERAAGIKAPANAAMPLTARTRSRHLYTDWQMSSYTALSALSLHDAPELPEDKAQEAASLPSP